MRKKEFSPQFLSLEVTDEQLTSAAGLGTLIELFDQTPLAKEFVECLPKRLSNKSQGSYALGLQLLASLVYGHDCLDDLEEFEDDPKLEKLFVEGVVAPRTMGDFLYDFEDEHIEKLRNFLGKMAKTIRKQYQEMLPETMKPSNAIEIKQDSTSHVQSGKKIEGVATNYKEEWCLDSLEAYDELGLCHDFELRSGSTFSSVNADLQIDRVFKDLKFTDEKYYSGDSAFCNQDVILKLVSRGAKFTITAHENMNWKAHIDEIENWQEWVYTKEEIERAKLKKKELPKIEVGRWYYTPGYAPNLKLPVIVKRTWIEAEDLFGGHWDHYAVITNFDLFQNSYQSVIEFHNKRGNAENFIREVKHNLDLKHFPCLKLKANFAYGLFAMIGMNLLRWVAKVEKPEKPHFAKKLRRRFIFIAGKIVTHARRTVIKVREKHYQEVMRLRMALQLEPRSALVPSPSG
jgi:hypothetical protein